MIDYLVKVLENSWLLSLIIPVVLRAFQDDPRARLKNRLMWAGFVLGLTASLAMAIVREVTGQLVREYYDLVLLIPSLVLTLFWIFFQAFPLIKKKGFWARSLIFLLIAFYTALVLPNIFLYPLEFGVGMDSIFNRDFLAMVTGYALGLLLIIFLAIFLKKLAQNFSPAELYIPFLCILLLMFTDLALDIARILVARNLLPRTIRLPGFFYVFLDHRNWLFYFQILIWTILSLALMVKSRLAVPVGDNPAKVRKSKAGFIKNFRLGYLCLIVLFLVFFSLTYLKTWASKGAEISVPLEVLAEDGRISLDLDVVSDGNLHRHMHKTENGSEVRFIVIKKSASAFGVGLDACDICGASGYYQRGDEVICKLCDVVMNKSTIGFPGGCNPVPLDFSIENGKLVIETEKLDAEAWRFE